MLVAAAYGVEIAAAIVTIVEGLLAYPRLPARIPYHFGFSGKPGSYGPKAFVVGLFALLALFLLATLAGDVFYRAASESASLSSKKAIVGAASLALLAYTQHAILDAARERHGRLPIRRFYLAFAAFVAVSASTNLLR